MDEEVVLQKDPKKNDNGMSQNGHE